MTEQELAGMIWNIKEIIRGVYDDTFRCAIVLKSLQNSWHLKPTQLSHSNP